MFKISSAIVLLIVASCQSSVTETKTEMEFAIDSLLVDRQVNDSALNISYHIPSGWIPIEAPVNKQPGIAPPTFFTNADTSVMFSTTDLRNMPDSVLRSILDNYKVVLNPDGKWNKIDAADFIKDHFQVRQYMMSKQGATWIQDVIFKKPQIPFSTRLPGNN